MSVIGAGSAAIGAGRTLINDKSFASLANLVKAVGTLGDEASPSLTRYANNTVITSAAFIDQSLVDDEVMIPMMGMLNQILCGFVLTALNLDRLTMEGRTVRDLLKAVSTESYVDVIGFTEDQFGSVEQYLDKPVASVEANVLDMDPSSQKLFSGRVIEVTFSAMAKLGYRDTTTKSGHSEHTDTKEHTTGSSQTVGAGTSDQDGKQVRTSSNGNSTDGSTTDDHKEGTTTKFDTTTTSGDKTGSSTKDVGGTIEQSKGHKEGLHEMSVYLYVQILPRIVHGEAIKGFVTMNFDPSWSQRWKQFRAGEISFWKDFIFAKDLLQKHANILKQDKTGTIADMLTKQRNKLATHLWSALTDDVSRHNLANSIVITSKKAFDVACAETGVDFDKQSDRTAYFNKTYSMFLVVVDNVYNTVDLYMNGISNVGSYSFNMINKNAKGKDAFDLKDMMTVMAQGQAPRF
jgi:hypothetical protein